MPAGNAASAQDESPHAAPPENKSTMTACQTLAQSPSATPHAASAPTTPASPPHQNLEHISICYFGCGKSTTRSPGPGVVKRSIGLFSPSLSSSLPVDVTQ